MNHVTSTTASLNRLQRETGIVTVHDRDGLLDTATTLSASSDNSTIATFAPSGSDGRTFALVGQGPGSVTVRLVGTNSHGDGVQVNINTTVSDVDLTDINITFGSPVPR